MLEFDIWGNVTQFISTDKIIWYKLTFFENDLLKYEDYLGNYWTPDFGSFPYLMVSFVQNNFPLMPVTQSLYHEISDDKILIRVTCLIFDYGDYVMPLVRRAYASTIASDLVPIQPMSSPIGSNVFFLDYIYEDEKWYQKIKRKFYLVMSKISRIFVPDKLKII